MFCLSLRYLLYQYGPSDPCRVKLAREILSVYDIISPGKTKNLHGKLGKNGKILAFKVNFLCQKISESLQKKISLKNMILGAHFLLLLFFENFNF